MTKRLALFDWKTGTFVAPEHRLQLGAYWGATHHFDPDALAWLPTPHQPTEAHLVQVRPKRSTIALSLTTAELRTAFVQFQSVLEVFTYFVGLGLWTIPDKAEYRIEDRLYPSVTYILSHVIAKPALLGWYAKMAREGKDPNAERDKRGAVGTTVHRNLLFYLEGKLVDLSAAPAEITESVSGFAAWSTKVKLEPVWTERKVCHMELGYAGTLDAVAWHNGEDA